MKIYFAGAIRGGRDDKEIYNQIIAVLKTYGEVLTEHVGDVDLSHMGEKDAVEFIYDRDIDWLNASDVVIAEVTQPSLGVGYELAIAEKLNKKILCLYRKTPNKSLSAMIVGNKAFKVNYYNSIKDLEKIFQNFLK